MELTHEQKQAFYDNGFVKLPGIIPRELVNEALRAINHSLGSEGMHPDNLTHLRFRTYCPELRDKPPIMNLLYESPLWSAIESAVGVGKVDPIKGSQIALRFPRADAPDDVDEEVSPERLAPMSPHIDGVKRMPKIQLPAPLQVTAAAGDAVLAHYMLGHGIAENLSPNIRYTIYFRVNHVDHAAFDRRATADGYASSKGQVTNFTGLVGVQLSDLPNVDSGNFTVWPGSHELLQTYYRETDPAALADFAYPDLITDMWREWEGMHDLARARADVR